MGFPITVDHWNDFLNVLKEQKTAQQEIANNLSKIQQVLVAIAPHKLKITYTPNLLIGDHKVQLTDIQSVTASVAETDAAGNPVAVDPSVAPVWAVSDPTILGLTMNADGSATLKAMGPLGSSQVTVTVGALNAQDTVTVVASAATTLAIKFGQPQ